MARITTRRHSRGLWLGACLALALSLLAGAASADSMRCGKRLVSTGDTLRAVRSLCGDPTSQQQRAEVRKERRRADAPCDRARQRCERSEWVTREVLIDEWVYDFGPRRLQQHLTFVDGKLDSIRPGSRGTRR